jgi:hypothetical protein
LGTLNNVKSLLYSLLVVAAVGLAGYFAWTRHWLGLNGGNSSVPTDEISSELRPAPVSWHEENRMQDGFRIDMPSDASEIQVPAYNQNGGAVEMEMLVAAPNAQTTYAVAWDDNPPVEEASGGSIERTLDNARDGALARTQTTLVGESKANFLGYPGREFTGRNANGGLFNARLILAGTKLYMMIAAFPAPSARRDEDVSHFFDSFKLAGR